MDRFEDALAKFEKLAEAFPHNREAKTLLSRCKLRLEEQRWGKYDWAEIISEARKGAPRIAVADYMGPIEQTNDDLFVAKQAIKAGELLLCCKAFATLYPEDLRGERAALVYDATRRVLGQAEGWKMTQAVAASISKNACTSKVVSPLAKGIKVHGEESDVLHATVDGGPIVDV